MGTVDHLEVSFHDVDMVSCIEVNSLMLILFHFIVGNSLMLILFYVL